MIGGHRNLRPLAAGKCPRGRLVYLRVEARPDPTLLERILGGLSRGTIRPVDVAILREGKWQQIDITFDGRGTAISHELLARIEALPAVRSAERVDGRGRPVAGVMPRAGSRNRARSVPDVRPSATPSSRREAGASL